MSKPQTLCLNMIVKNESKIIKDTLAKLCSKISFDHWIISDTGSTDNTVEIIESFFKEKNIPGKIFHDAWENFAHNRTLALNHAYNLTDYLLIFDADDSIEGSLVLPKPLRLDGYHLKFYSGDIIYERILLINNRKKWEYKSVIHEFITCITTPNYTRDTIQGNYKTISGRSGARNLDPNKYLKDALILENEANKLKTSGKDPDNLLPRYSFYCANSYKDSGRPEKAIEWYIERLKYDGWNQEQYMSCMFIYEMYVRLGKTELGYPYLMQATKYDLERVEWMYYLLKFCYERNLFNLAYGFYMTGKEAFDKNINYSSKFLFNINMYEFSVPFELIIVAWNVKDFDMGLKMFEIIFTKKKFPQPVVFTDQLMKNYEFFKGHIKSSDKAKFNKLYTEYFSALGKIDSVPIIPKPKFPKQQCKDSKNIMIYTGFSYDPWNLSFLKDHALGGAEKAVLYVATELSKKLGNSWKIYIGGGVGEETVGNITFVPNEKIGSLVSSIPLRSLLVSRYIGYYEMFPHTSFYKSFIWSHDNLLLHYGSSLTVETILSKWNSSITKCICLTQWHKDMFSEKYPILKNKIILNNNGIIPELFPEITHKIPNSFIYTTRPERGLVVLLDLWPKILEILPNATLNLSTYETFPQTEEDHKMQAIIDKYDSITHHGKLNTKDLYELSSKMEYWLYPCIYPETCCIAGMEMLMSGIVCIYYPLAGLVNTMGGCGVQTERGKEIETILSIQDKKETLVREGMEYAKTCTWESRAEVWKQILTE